MIDVNLTGTFNTTRAVMRPMLKQKSGGRIVNVASVAGIYETAGRLIMRLPRAALLLYPLAGQGDRFAGNYC